MQLRMRYFAGLRESLGVSSEQFTAPGTVRTVDDVVVALRQRGGNWAEALADASAFRVAVDQRMCALSSPVHEGIELALFPPVTGG
ncbi:MoaD/ThiS family protein [Massilia aerilata]|uniref:MoaD/ThiS family protein n=1 Tax=Massilia aerilata TaxID=453817 RepID=A0ABW0RZT9_9BURK